MATLNALFGIVLMDFSKDIWNTLYDSELQFIPLFNRIGKKRVRNIFWSTKNLPDVNVLLFHVR